MTIAYRTRFTELVGCAWPVQLAAMGGGTGGPELAAAVGAAGGLGMVSWTDEIPDPACGVNFLVPFLPGPGDITAIAQKASVAEFFFGTPCPEAVRAAKSAGAVVGWQVGSAEEARLAVEAGCDYVVAQGNEAGGHVRARRPLDEVLAEVRAEVDVAVLAAGGIATAERVAEVLGAGADGVRVGTRFLICPESRAHPQYVANLLAASGEDTVLTEWFDEGWPEAPHRVLRRALQNAQSSGWRSTQPPVAGADHSVADMAQYAGTGVGQVARIESAAEVVADLVRLLRG
jgi:NAD(P)H-dependent flavin oxidoreductase YrpB (nitropropane dioxygenase family)